MLEPLTRHDPLGRPEVLGPRELVAWTRLLETVDARSFGLAARALELNSALIADHELFERIAVLRIREQRIHAPGSAIQHWREEELCAAKAAAFDRGWDRFGADVIHDLSHRALVVHARARSLDRERMSGGKRPVNVTVRLPARSRTDSPTRLECEVWPELDSLGDLTALLCAEAGQVRVDRVHVFLGGHQLTATDASRTLASHGIGEGAMLDVTAGG